MLDGHTRQVVSTVELRPPHPHPATSTAWIGGREEGSSSLSIVYQSFLFFQVSRENALLSRRDSLLHTWINLTEFAC